MKIPMSWIRHALGLDDHEPEPLWDYIPIDGEPAPAFPKPFHFASSYQVIGETYPGMYTKEHGWLYWMARAGKEGGVPLNDPELLEWVAQEYVAEEAKPLLVEGDVMIIPKETFGSPLDLVAFIEIDNENATLTVEGWADVVTCGYDGQSCGDFYVLTRDNIEKRGL
jgi:hypothetical protein